jgi:hypothetical protein
MTQNDLFSLVERAKCGDKDAMYKIIVMFQPSINKACRYTHPNEQNDLRQYLTEKVIRAVLSYDLGSVPAYFQFINQTPSKSKI